LKARTPDARIAAGIAVQRHLHGVGFPCPEPLAGPAPLGGLSATAEAFVPGGELLAPGPDLPEHFATLLAELVRLAPPPETLPAFDPPPWAAWRGAALWPPPDDRDADLNAHREPVWIDDLARHARHVLDAVDLPAVVGHVDWESQNLRWVGRQPHVVHDWDSVACLPEAVVAGSASVVFPNDGTRGTATLEEGDAFLTAYAQARGQPWSGEERSVAWAAGLWTLAFNAKKESLDGDGPLQRRLFAERDERQRRAE
jgi:hypothetical protein